MADVGTGITIGFGEDGYDAEILSISYSGEEVAVIDTSHMGTEGYRTHMFGDLIDGGEITVSINFDPDKPVPVGTTADDITITFPMPTGQAVAATMVFAGGIRTGSFDAPLEDKMTGTYAIKVFGEPEWSASEAEESPP